MKLVRFFVVRLKLSALQFVAHPSFCPEHSEFPGCNALPLIYHISNYIQF